MTKIAVYLEIDNGKPSEESLALLSGARSLAASSEVVAIVVGANEPAASLAANYADTVVTIAVSGGGYVSQAHLAALKSAIEAESPDLVLFVNSYVGIDLIAATALQAGYNLATYCSSLSLDGGNLRALSRTFGGKLNTEISCSLPAVAGINAGVFKPGEARSSAGAIRAMQPADGEIRMSVKATHPRSAEGIDITSMDRLVCVGRGIGDEANIDQARQFADAIGAELVASRPVVDAGWMEKNRQVGKSGRTVKPKLYIALGVSGAPEHLEGMSGAETIIAVNTDPQAPIFDVAKYGITCDVLELLEELEGLLDA